MNIETSIAIGAPPEHVWAVLLDLERWPEWTASMERVERLGGGEFAAGSRVRVKQPRMAAMDWDVTAFEPGRAFTWMTKRPGVTSEADHEIVPDAGGSRVTLRVRQRGPLAWLVGLAMGGRMRRYVQLEAEGLKQRCEGAGETR